MRGGENVFILDIIKLINCGVIWLKDMGNVYVCYLFVCWFYFKDLEGSSYSKFLMKILLFNKILYYRILFLKV